MTGNEEAKLSLPDCVPEPDPAQSDRLVGAHYFPGWKPGTHRGWGVLKDFPERRPLLGYYDESNPEVTDWEIKWALEHGSGFGYLQAVRKVFTDRRNLPDYRTPDQIGRGPYGSFPDEDEAAEPSR
jgi:hypothetical protein